MIRREPAAPDAAGATWILISQVDHAHLAGRLAEHWGAGDVLPLVARDQLLWAIEHHDDGWDEWEQTPDVEPTAGRPRSFTEMRLDEGLEIWGRSIITAAEHDALAGFVVSGHFCALLRRFDAAWKDKPAQTQMAEQFLATYDHLREGCLKAWLARSPDHSPELAERALHQLQLFDALSLWFCCCESPEAEAFATPSGPAVLLEMTDLSGGRSPQTVTAAPWPLAVEGLNLEIPGRAVPLRRYQGRADLAAVPLQNVQLGWRLAPAALKS
jgi:hypothetical protein